MGQGSTGMLCVGDGMENVLIGMRWKYKKPGVDRWKGGAGVKDKCVL